VTNSIERWKVWCIVGEHGNWSPAADAATVIVDDGNGGSKDTRLKFHQK